MKRLGLALVAMMTLTTPVHAAIGLGLGFASPMAGISVYDDVAADRFVQGFLGVDSPDFMVNGDYCVAVPGAIKTPSLTPYYGGGLTLRFWHDEIIDREYGSHYRRVFTGSETFAGVRIPLGLLFNVPNTPLQIAGELAPGLMVVPATDVFIDFMLGIRYVFK